MTTSHPADVLFKSFIEQRAKPLSLFSKHLPVDGLDHLLRLSLLERYLVRSLRLLPEACNELRGGFVLVRIVVVWAIGH